LVKAFDTVDHGELINILPGFGINEESLSWFSSYLENRTQLVSVNNELSSKEKIDCGVPQGSVLGPFLFILYINTICDLNTGGLVVTYADDTCLFFFGKVLGNCKRKSYNRFK